MSSLPLQGRRVGITRPRPKAEEMAARLHALGAEPVIIPLIDIHPPEDYSSLDDAVHSSPFVDWIVFTSANAVNAFFERAHDLEYSVREADRLTTHPNHLQLERVRFAVVGGATRAALRQNLPVDPLMPAQATAEALADALIEAGIANKRVLLPQADIARPVLAEQLRTAGAHVQTALAYHTLSAAPDPHLFTPALDAITFASSSAAVNFDESFEAPAEVLAGAAVICIGPVTAEAVRGVGLPVDAVAEPHDLDGLINAVIHLLGETAR